MDATARLRNVRGYCHWGESKKHAFESIEQSFVVVVTVSSFPGFCFLIDRFFSHRPACMSCPVLDRARVCDQSPNLWSRP